MKRVHRVVALSLALGLVGAACGDDDDTSSPGTTAGTGGGTTAAPTVATTAAPDVCTAERKGGSLTFGTLSPTTSLDPITALGSGSAGGIELAALFDQLLRYNPQSGEYEPHVAQSFSANADKSEWTVKLRPNVKFGNGDALTADAVKFSFERMAKATVSSAGLAAEVTSMTIPDPLTIVFKLKGPFGEFPYVLAEDTGAIVNPKVVAAMTPQEFARTPKGAGVGPYEIERFAPNEEVVMKAKADYWGGPVCIETLRFINVSGGRGTYEAFKKNEMQMALINDAQVIAEAKGAGTKGFENISSGNVYIVMNQGVRGTQSPFTDIRLRRAVAMAVDPNIINQRVFGGKAMPGTTIIAKESPLSPGVDGPKLDVEGAKKLVAEAKAAGFSGKIRLTGTNVQTAVEQSITIEAMLEAVGFDVTVESLPPAEANRRVLTEPNFDLGFSGLSIFEELPWARLNQFETGSVRSRTGYGNPNMDKALTQLKAASNRAEKKAAIGEIQKVWNETIPSAVVMSTTELLATAPQVRGITVTRDTVPLFHKAYIAK